MKGYWLILKGSVGDQDAQTEYNKLWAPIAEKYQARIAPRETPPVLREARDAQQVLIVEFPSYEAAQQCYDDPAYGEACRFALKAANRELVLLKGDLA